MLSKPLPESSVGKVLLGAEIDGQQIANGVGVFVAVQAARGHAAGIGLDVAVGFFELALHVVSSASICGCGGRGMPFGGISPERIFAQPSPTKAAGRQAWPRR